MTYLQIINLIKDTALAQPNVNSVVREFLDLNREDAKYSAVVIQDRDGSRDRIVEQDYITYTWHLGYVDRLTYDESNRDDIISTGINIINNIVNTIRNTWFPELEVSIVDRINTFDQRFTAQCAGVYVVLAVNAQVSDCIDSESTDLYDTYDAKITANGVYHFVPSGRPVDEINITVDVESSKPEESLIETITSNGSYSYTPEEGSVFSDVSIAVDVHPTERLVETITSNGSYNYPGEYSGVEISVDCPVPKTEERGNLTISSNGSGVLIPSSGNVFDGVDYIVDVHPSDKLVETIITNGITDLSGEWKDASITVDVHPSDKLIKTYTENGIYNVSGEWKDAAITVAIPVKTETSLTKSISNNGSYHYEPEDGSVFNVADITVDVHPSVSLSKTYTSNGSYNISGEFNGGTVTVAVSGGGEKPEESLVETISSNGSYHYDPSPGSVFSDADITVDVHPSSSLSKTYTTNGTKTITGEFNGGSITINVHPTTKLSKTYTENGTYNISGEWKDASIAVNVPSTSTVTMTQAQYDALTVKDPNTIYLING